MSKTQIITGVERRRRFSTEQKLKIVSEIAETSLSEVSRTHGIAMSVLSTWKKKLKPKSFAFAQIEVDSSKSLAKPSEPALAESREAIRIVINMRIVVELPLSIEPGAVAKLIRALEG